MEEPHHLSLNGIIASEPEIPKSCLQGSTTTYAVTVTDANGCTEEGSVTVTVHPNPSVTISCSADTGDGCILCAGESTTLTANPAGGTGPYTYVWSNGHDSQQVSVSPAVTTDYTVTITDINGCTAQETITVIVHPTPHVSISKNNATCGFDNGSVVASATGGTAPFTYSWSDGLGNGASKNDLGAGTYTVTVTDVNGCTDTESVTIINIPGPGLDVHASPAEICDGGSTDLTAVVTGGTAPFTYVWSNGLGNGPNKTVSPSITTTYSVTVTDGNDCTETAAVTVTVNYPPIVSTSTTDATCGGANGSATVVASGGGEPYTYLWSNGATTANIVGIVAGSYDVTVTNTYGCITETSVTVNNIGGPLVSAAASPAAICIGETSILTATVNGGTPPFTYAWSGGGSGSTKNVNPTTTTTYTVTVTDNNDCEATASVTVTVNPLVSVEMDGEDATCDLSNGSASVSVLVGTAPFSYLWNTGATTAQIDNLTAGTYSVVVTDANGCAGSGSVVIDNLPAPDVDAGINREICLGDEVTLVANVVSGGTTPFSYQWNNGAGNGVSVTVSPASTTTYTVTVTDINGCMDSDQVTVIVHPNPTVSFSKTDATCGASNGSATATPANGSAPYAYQWSGGLGTSATISNVPSGTYTVLVTDNNGCQISGSVTIEDINGPTVTASPDVEICFGESTTLTAMAQGGTLPYSYAWSNGAGSGSSVSVSPNTTTTYTVTVTDQNGCVATDQVVVTVNPAVSVNLGPDKDLCADGCLVLNGSNITGGTGPFTYAWSTGETSSSIVVCPLGTTTYTLNITDAKGCTATDDITIIVHPNPVVTLVKTDASCGASNGTATASTTGGTPPYSYAWSNGAAGAVNVNLAPGTYVVTVTDGFGCSDSEVIQINSLDGPTIQVSPDAEICQEQSATLTAQVISGGTPPFTYAWSNGGSTSSITVSPNNTTTFTVIVTDANNCSDNGQVTVIVNPKPAVSITAAPEEICVGFSSVLTAAVTNGTPPYTYSWSNGLGNSASHTVSPVTTTTYSLVVTDAEGCVADETTVTVTVNENPTATVTVNANESCAENDGSLTANPSGGTPPYAYQWDDVNNSTTQTISGLMSGSYNVTITDAKGCVVSAVGTVASRCFDLALRKTFSSGVLLPGGNVTFNIEVINQGTVDAANVQVSDYIPNGLTLNDPNWSGNGTIVTRTISVIPANTSASVSISFDISSDYQQSTIVNYAEISGASNTFNLTDYDSTPDQNNANDAGGQPDSPADNYVDGNGTGGIGNGVASTDEDDHDPALINLQQTFDLALRKTVMSNGPFSQNSIIVFQIEVFNQGTVDATNVEITDYIPTGFTLVDGAWNQSGSLATRTIAGPIAANGGSATISISFQVESTFQGTSIVNYAEISGATNPLGLSDIDSNPDQNNANDAGGQPNSPADDHINGDGSGVIGNGVASTDEDDHDPAFISINQTFDLALTKTLTSNGPFNQGSQVNYDIEVTNEGSLDAFNVEVTDHIPTGMSYVSGGWSVSGSDVTQIIPSLPQGQSVTLSITLQIDPTFQGASLTNKAEITSDDGDDTDSNPDTGEDVDEDNDGNGDDDDEDDETITINQTYDLALTKTLTSNGPFNQNSLVNYNIVVTNEGSLNAFNVEVTDHIPTGMSYVSGGWSVSGSDVTQIIPSLPQGQSVTLSITLQIDPTFQGTSLTNKAEITEDDGDDTDSNPETGDDVDEDNDGDGDDDDEDEATIPVSQVYDLALTKTLTSSGPFSQGSQVSYDIVVTNEGSLDAFNVVVTDHIPPGMSYVSGGWSAAGGSDVAKNIPSLLQGQSVTLSITLQIDATFQGTSLTNKAEITEDDGDDTDSNPETGDDVDEDNDGDGDDDDEDKATIPVSQIFDLALVKTMVSSGPYVQSSTVTYQIEVINQGSLDATNVEITDYIPTGLNLTDGAWTQAGNLATRTITGPIAANGGTATITITFEIDANFQGTGIDNYAEISSADNALGQADVDSTPDQDNTNDTLVDNEINNGGGDEDDHDIEPITVEQAFDLALRKTTISAGPYTQGSTVTYQIEVINQGSLDATDVEITDYIPTGLNLTDGAWAQAGNLATRTIAGPIAANGGTATITITFEVDANFQGTGIDNYAEISSADNALGQADVDSAPDQDNTNDTLVDNEINNGGGDEDDHDIEPIDINQTFDLALRKTTISAGPYTQGSTVTYQIEVINQGSLDATDVEITDYIPTGLNLTDGAWTQAGNLATRTIAGPIAANGGTATITITFEIDANFQGTGIDNYAEISSADNALGQADVDSTPDQDNTNDTLVDDEINNGGGDEDDHDIEPITVEQAFDLALRKTTISAGPYTQGSTVTYQIEVINQGSLDATDVEITDYIPTGLNLTDGTWTQSGSLATRTIPGPIAANGGTATITITFEIDANFQGTGIDNYAEISSADNALGQADVDSTPDQDNTNDTLVDDEINNGGGDEDDHDIEPITIDQTFDLALDKTLLSAGPFVPGSTVSYTISVTNEGTLDATNIEVTDYIPTGLNYVSGGWTVSGNQATQTIASLAKGATATLTITFMVDIDFQATSINNCAEISGANNVLGQPDVDSTPDQNDMNDVAGEDDFDCEPITIDQTFDLALDKTLLSAGPFIPGSTVSYTISVTNEGTLDATNIEVTDYIPAGLNYVSGGWTVSGNLATQTIASLAKGATATLTITFMVDIDFQATSINNCAEISGANNVLGQPDVDSTPDQNDMNDVAGEDDFDCEPITIDQTFDLTLDKTLLSAGPFVPGSTVSYTISVTNEGTLDATNIEVTDYIPAGLNYVSGGWTVSGNQATQTIASLAKGATETLTITFMVDIDFQATSINNCAEISGASNVLGQPDVDSTPDQNDMNDLAGEDDFDCEPITIDQTFDLALDKTLLSAGPFVPGSTVEYTISVTNEGTLDATNIEVTDYIPMGLNYVSGGWTVSGNLATQTIASLAKGATETLTITFMVDIDFQATSINNCAEISGASNVLGQPDVDSTPDQNDMNDVAGEDDFDCEPITIDQTFDLTLDKTLLSAGPFVPGSTVSYTISVTNEGTLDATNIEVTDYIPAGLNYVSGGWTVSGNQATQTIASLAKGATETLTITFMVDIDFQATSINNCAEISGASNVLGQPDVDSTPDQNDMNDVAGEDDFDCEPITIDQTFDLALDKTLLSAGPFIPGSTVSYTISVTNEGTLDATNIEVTDYIPTGLNYVSGGWTVSGNQATQTIASLAKGATATLTITFMVDIDFQATSINNCAEISGANNELGQPDVDSTPDQNDMNDVAGEDDFDCEPITIDQTFDLALDKT